MTRRLGSPRHLPLGRGEALPGNSSCSPPPRRRTRLAVAVPYSYALTEHKPLLRAYKWGILARLLGVYRVDEIVLYQAAGEEVDKELAEEARTILEYLVTAPYLRRRLYPLTPLLRHIGAVPPLQLPTHGVGGPRRGECREALVLETRGDRIVLDAGLRRPAVAEPGPGQRPRRGERVLVTLLDPGKGVVRLGCSPTPYSGYRVATAPSLRAVVETARARGDRVIATSRLGRVATPGLLRRLARGAGPGVTLLFGSPWTGLHELARREGWRLEDTGAPVLNMVPCQGTRTVRVEEAVAATLALLNLYLD